MRSLRCVATLGPHLVERCVHIAHALHLFRAGPSRAEEDTSAMQPVGTTHGQPLGAEPMAAAEMVALPLQLTGTASAGISLIIFKKSRVHRVPFYCQFSPCMLTRPFWVRAAVHALPSFMAGKQGMFQLLLPAAGLQC